MVEEVEVERERKLEELGKILVTSSSSSSSPTSLSAPRPLRASRRFSSPPLRHDPRHRGREARPRGARDRPVPRRGRRQLGPISRLEEAVDFLFVMASPRVWKFDENLGALPDLGGDNHIPA